MKAVILAGGMGTRIAEESVVRPKPMIEIGGRPILWHILKIYGAHGITDFVVCLGYKGYMIKEYFANMALHNADFTADVAKGEIVHHNSRAEPWRVTLVDTGEATQTGGRLKRALPYIGDDDFCLTYGDGVGNIDITALVAFHRAHGKMATITAVIPPARYGALDLEGDTVRRFTEKPPGQDIFVNGGYFVVSPKAVALVSGDEIAWEGEPLEQLAERRELRAFRHTGFWHPMDTVRDRSVLETLWASGKAPWQVWQ
jgi:glucose-1-phosphate cytidylyltransferase